MYLGNSPKDPISVSTNAPSVPKDGDVWFNSALGETFVYYDDGNTSQWVQLNPSGQQGPAGPTGPAGANGEVARTELDAYLQVANSTSFASSSQLNAYLQVANATTLTSFDVITTAPSGNGSLVYTSANGSFTFTPADATQGGGSGGGASVTISDASPGSPSAGDLWWSANTNQLFIYYTDVDSNQWVEATTPGPVGPTGPTGPTANLSSLASSLIPSSNVTFDLGSQSMSWRDLYLSGNTIFLSTSQITLNANGGIDLPTGSRMGGTSIVTDFVKSYRYDDTLAINTGTKRLYLQDSYTLKSIHAFVDTAPVGSSVNTSVKKNGSSLQNIIIAAGATSASNTSLNHSFVSGDYITVDITQVGSTTAGENLYIVFTFN
jgi:hypothetical protein